MLRLESAPAKSQLQLESLLQRDPASVGLAFRNNRQTRICASGCKEKVSSFFVGADLAVASSFKNLLLGAIEMFSCQPQFWSESSRFLNLTVDFDLECVSIAGQVDSLLELYPSSKIS